MSGLRIRARNFTRSLGAAGSVRNSGSVVRSAWATTDSDGGCSGFMVRSQLRNRSHTVGQCSSAKSWSRPCDAGELHEAVIGGELAAHLLLVDPGALADVLVAAATLSPPHLRHPEV